MLRTLKDLFDVFTPAAPQPAARREHTLQLATAVLLVEVMRSDADIGVDERKIATAALKEKFALGDDELARLLDLAERTAHAAHDFHSFTSKINDAFDTDEKVRIVEQMWRVAYADGHLSAHENHVMWRVADLLHVPHPAYIGAKMRAKAAAADKAP